MYQIATLANYVIILQNSYSWSMIKISLLGYIMDIYVCVYVYV